MKKYRQFTEEEIKWCKSFESLMNKAPKDLFMFVGAGFAIYSERVMTDGGAVDDNCPSFSITTPMTYDGGDY